MEWFCKNCVVSIASYLYVNIIKLHYSYEELPLRRRETTIVVISGFTAQVDRISSGCLNQTIYALVMRPDYLRYTRTLYASVNCLADQFRGRTISAATPGRL